jgi:hypothetical protein
LSRISNEKINRCQYLCHFIGMMHSYFTDRCLINLQSIAMSESLAKTRAQITMNQAYFKRYESFLIQLDSLVKKSSHQYKVASLDRFSEVKRLLSQRLPLILNNDQAV